MYVYTFYVYKVNFCVLTTVNLVCLIDYICDYNYFYKQQVKAIKFHADHIDVLPPHPLPTGSDVNSMDSVDSCSTLGAGDGQLSASQTCQSQSSELIVWEIEVPKVRFP